MQKLVPTCRFGRTELRLPVLFLGGDRYMHSWTETPDIPTESQRNVEAVVDAAFQDGICHVHTNPTYGTSARQLGLAISRYPRPSFVVQAGPDPDKDPAEFKRVFRRLLETLGLNTIDLLTIHGINNDERFDATFRTGGCFEVARRLQTEGACRHIGFSTHGETDLICKTIEQDVLDYVFLHYYFVDSRHERALDLAAERDMGVLIISPNEMGGKLHDPPRKLRDLCAPLHPMAFNLLHCLADERIHALSIGAAHPRDLDAHVETVTTHYPSRQEISRPISERLQAALSETMGPDWYRRWYLGLPSWDELSDEINVIQIVRLWAFAKTFDMYPYAKARYNLLGQAGHWYAGEKARHVDRSALEPRIRQNAFANRICDWLEEAHAALEGPPIQRLSRQEEPPTGASFRPLDDLDDPDVR